MIRKYLLYILSLFLLLIIILAIPGRDSFRMGAEDVLEKIDSQDYIISTEQMEVLKEKDNACPVYLGNPEDFDAYSLPGAVNLPLTDLSVKKIYESLNGSETYILYSDDLATSCQAWVLLTQMGYEKVFVLDTD
jgi:hypothetical protein